MNSSDIAFMLIATAFVMFMTPGLGLFYGGMVRSKNALGTIMQSFISLGIVSLIWILYGYTIAFGPDIGGIIGGFDHLFLKGVGFEAGPYSSTIPGLLFCVFQLMFAIITPALITGAYAERMKFSAFLLFTVLWTTFVYLPVCHWVWGGGWLSKLGVLDFAGGNVIHINSGVAALVASFFIGKRRGWGRQILHPHNLPMTFLGTAILWFGWFGFNAGSALSAGNVAILAFFNTHIASGMGCLSWLLVEWWIKGKPTTLGAASGAIAGLATVTNAAGFVSPMSASIIGLIGGVFCYLAILVKDKFGYDDALDVVGVHGVGGLIGALATGLFAQKIYNAAGADGLFFGNPSLFVSQFIGAVVTVIYSVVLTLIILKIIDAIVGIRVSSDEELQGLDISQHSEIGYSSL